MIEFFIAYKSIILALLNLIGLVLGICGTFLTAVAIDQSDSGIRFKFGENAKSETPVFLKKPQFLKCGLRLIFLGFLFQLVSGIFQIPTPSPSL
ncbi:MAG: hypothetical protein KBD00_01805 [Candidatus Peribacteraceae bacterium]|nr:hypothetical protein [Candidatus Peribacteraceae bacterium]